jgi:hypothetical protein
MKPRRADDSTRCVMGILNRMFPWREALVMWSRSRPSDGSAKDFGCSGAGSRSRGDDRA